MNEYGARHPGAGGATHRPVGGGDDYDGPGRVEYTSIGERCWTEETPDPRGGIFGSVVDRVFGERTATEEHCEEILQSPYASDPSITRRTK